MKALKLMGWLASVSLVVVTGTYAVPLQITQQGRLLDASDAPIDGTVSMTFSIFETPTGGSPLWSETFPTVEVLNGLYSVELGTDVGNPLTPEHFVDRSPWLEISVDAEPLVPRLRISSVPYAVATGTVDGATGGVVNGNLQVTGHVTIGGSVGAKAQNDPGVSSSFIHEDETVLKLGDASAALPLEITVNGAHLLSLSTNGSILAGLSQTADATRVSRNSTVGELVLSGGNAVDNDDAEVVFCGGGHAATPGEIIFRSTAEPFIARYAPDGDIVFAKRLGIGGSDPERPLDVVGLVRSRVGGFEFPDGTVQTTASTGGGVASVGATAPLSSTGGTNPVISLSSSGCQPGQILKWDGSSWVCAADGLGDVCSSPSSGSLLRWNGSSWVCTSETGIDDEGSLRVTTSSTTDACATYRLLSGASGPYWECRDASDVEVARCDASGSLYCTSMSTSSTVSCGSLVSSSSIMCASGSCTGTWTCSQLSSSSALCLVASGRCSINLGSSVCMLESTDPSTSCMVARAAVGQSAAVCRAERSDGTPYWVIDPTTNAMQVFCDMTTDGGGWTLSGLTTDKSSAIIRQTSFLTPSSSVFDITNSSGTSSFLCVAGDGRVGIGKSQPEASLHVASSGSDYLVVWDHTAGVPDQRRWASRVEASSGGLRLVPVDDNMQGVETFELGRAGQVYVYGGRILTSSVPGPGPDLELASGGGGAGGRILLSSSSSLVLLAGQVLAQGNAQVQGDMTVVGGLTVMGPKMAGVETSQGRTEIYCQESPEVWIEDFGEGQLQNGRTHIDLDPLYLETVTINDQHQMKVFIQPNDDFDAYVKRGKRGFDVIQTGGLTGNGQFTYRVVAKRKGYENYRLEPAKSPVIAQK